MSNDIKTIIYGINDIANDFLYLFDDLKIIAFLYDREEKIESLSTGYENISKYSLDDCDIKSISKGCTIIICGFDYLEKEKILISYGMREDKDYIFAHSVCELFHEKDLDSLLKRVFYSERKYKQLQCAVPFRMVSIATNRIHTCCGGRVSISITRDFSEKIEEFWFTLKRKIMCLSVMNGTYAFCNRRYCPLLHSYDGSNSKQADIYYTQDISGYNYYSYPDILQLEYDAACNLACPSCRNNYVCDSGKKAEHITSYVLKNIVPYITHIRCAGFGEALFSKNYKHIISSEETRNKELYLLTNGLLLDYKKAMDLLCHFSKLSIDVSVDAGTEEVYKLIRGGNYSLLIRNLHDISKLHLSGNISKFVLNYTVSKKNICDLNHFLKMAEDLNVDSVRISAIHNWGNMTKDEFEDMSILDANFKLKSEVCEYFKNMDAFDVKILDNNVGFEELTKT